ncbi:hypothetical protein ELI_0812 [Eubacterium callanderi]|uniref:Uncharacterized protein n=1 Tax=Eubacterium callanderi TaxID=53442 RepID=E3GJJ1_9FIRM|nr:hypothetical protein ELI_0812 [Eubacterium callanderi]
MHFLEIIILKGYFSRKCVWFVACYYFIIFCRNYPLKLVKNYKKFLKGIEIPFLPCFS